MLDEFKKLRDEGNDIYDIVKNIFLNYESYNNKNVIFELKSCISKHFNVPFSNIRLIGSAHTGFKKEKDNFIHVDSPSDYDLAIIDAELYNSFLLRIKSSELPESKLVKLANNIMIGKLHFAYVDSGLSREVKDILETVEGKINSEKRYGQLDAHVSICIYQSEDSFLKSLESYFKNVNLTILKGNYKKSNQTIKKLRNDGFGPLKNFKLEE